MHSLITRSYMKVFCLEQVLGDLVLAPLVPPVAHDRLEEGVQLADGGFRRQ